ncbi:serine/threonine-protein phosphatase [Streptosporangiaceae bacterium NEAU-GS5]|nr:serine/threonine-protein phosphatase [Streptosporangiaceae bacterium NEAU-GS5]
MPEPTVEAMADVVTVTAMTHVGAVREQNEDALAIGPVVALEVSMAHAVTCTMDVRRPFVVAVADGLGGHAGGEVAAAHIVRGFAREGERLEELAAVADLVRQIDAELTDEAARQPSLAGMAATVAGLLFTPAETNWFNVGDSRVYQLDDRYLGQLSVDDSPLAGEPGAAAPVTHVVTQVIGGSGTAIEVHGGPSTRHGCWLLCSDGLTDLVAVSELEEVLCSSQDDAHAVKRMWALAMNASGRDNITIVLARRRGDSGEKS